MPGREEKERRRQLRNALQNKGKVEFEHGLPMSREGFKELFDHLDRELQKRGCDHTCGMTTTFLSGKGVADLPAVMRWLDEHGGYCDCEVLVDRTYVLPLGDLSWPDDTRVEFEYMDGE